jgi:outer membrane protein TolC
LVLTGLSKSVALTIVLMGGPTILAAQEQTTLTLNSAVDLALRNHPEVREVRAASNAAAGEVDVARTAYWPRLDALWQANRATRNNVFGLLLPQTVVPPVSGPVIGETLDGVWSSAGGLLFSWEAVDFGRRDASVALARAQSSLADAQRRTSELDIAGHAADAFLGVLAAEATLTAARANVERLSVFAETVRALVENQLRAGAEGARAEAELAAARNRLAEADRDAAVARIILAEAVGRPGARIEVNPGALSRLPPPAPERTFAAALHPRAVAAEAAVEAARARDRVIDTSFLPRVDLQSAISGRSVGRQIDGESNGSGFGLDVQNWALGVSVSFPSLEIFRAHARRRVEAERRQEASAHYDRTVQTLESQEARARAITAAALQIAANTPRQLQAARDTDAQARARYDAGLTSVVEVAEAQRLLAAAEAENAVAGLAVWRALLAEAVLAGNVQSFTSALQASPGQ